MPETQGQQSRAVADMASQAAADGWRSFSADSAGYGEVNIRIVIKRGRVSAVETTARKIRQAKDFGRDP